MKKILAVVLFIMVQLNVNAHNNFDAVPQASTNIYSNQNFIESSASNEVTVTLVTDNYGNETAWNISNEADEIVMDGNNYTNNETFVITDNLPAGCYIFNIVDTYGDGLCCLNGNGSYEVKVGDVVVASGAEFTNTEKTEFCIEGNVETPVEDTNAPTVPQGLVADNVTTNSLNLSWDVSTDDASVEGYYVYQNGNRIETISENTIAISDLASGTEYTYNVSSFDAAGNESSQSENLVVVTDEEVVNEQTSTTSGEVTITLNTDNYGTETAWNIKNEAGSIVYSGNDYASNTTVVIKETLSEGCYTFIIADSYGDGMCCLNGNGSYEVKVGETVIASGAEFTNKEEYDFCIGNIDTEDTEAPSVPAELISTNVSSNSVTLSWTSATDNKGVVGYNVYQNGSKVTTVSETNVVISNLIADTEYTFTVSAMDAAGNESAQADNLVVSTIGNNTEEESSQSGEVTVTVNTDNYGTETAWNIKNASGDIVMNGSDYTSNNTFTSTELLEAGCYTFTIADSYGDGMCCLNGNGSYEVKVGSTIVGSGAEFTNSEEVEFCVEGATSVEDTQAPSIPVDLTSSNVTINSVSLSWASSTDNVQVKGYNVYQDGTKVETVSETSKVINGLSPSTAYTFSISAFDAAGNESNQSEVLVVTTNEVIGNGTTGDVTVTINTDNYGSETTWNIKNSTGNIVMSGTGYTSNNTFTSTESLEAGCYTFTIVDSYGDGICCLNGDGSYEIKVGDTVVGSGAEFTNSEEVEFCIAEQVSTQEETEEEVDTMAPTIPTNLAASAIDYTTATLSWTASTDDTSVAGYNVYQNGVKIDSLTTTAFNLQDLEQGTQYIYSVSAYDAEGNESAKSNGVAFKTFKEVVGNTGDVTVKIFTDNYGQETTWTVKDAEGNIVMESVGVYDKLNIYEETTSLPDGCYTFTINDKFGDGICCQNGDGYYDVKVGNVSVGYGGEFTSSESVEFCVGGDEEEDTIAPSVPTSLVSSNITNSSFELSWTPATDNTEVLGYNIYQDGELIGAFTETTITVTNLQQSTTYSYSVTALDSSGNESELSEAISVTTIGQEVNVVTIKITTDNYGAETAWDIKDENENIVLSGNGYASNTTYTVEEVLELGCYTFNIIDTYGDGMCCTNGNGSYEVLVNGTSVLNGAEFSVQETKDFCTSGTASAKEEVSSLIENKEVEALGIFPNPIRFNQVNVEAKTIEKGMFTIVDKFGNLIKTGDYNGGKQMIQVKTLPTGFYLVKIIDTQGQIEIGKILVD